MNETEINNPPAKEVKVTVIKRFNKFRRMNGLSENFNQVLVNIKKESIKTEEYN